MVPKRALPPIRVRYISPSGRQCPISGLRGRFLLSLNDCPEVRTIFAGFEIKAVETSYTIARGPGQRVGEVLISGRR